MPLIKNQIVENVAEQMGVTKESAKDAVETLIEIIKKLWNPVSVF